MKPEDARPEDQGDGLGSTAPMDDDLTSLVAALSTFRGGTVTYDGPRPTSGDPQPLVSASFRCFVLLSATFTLMSRCCWLAFVATIIPPLAFVVVSLMLAGRWADRRSMIGFSDEEDYRFSLMSNSDHFGAVDFLLRLPPRCDFCLRTRPR